MKLRELAAWTLVLLLALGAIGGVVLALSSNAVERITVHYADGSVQDFVPAASPATVTPTLQVTAQPTATPTSTPTTWWTATPTPTLIPTNTPRPTVTPVPASATPTQEVATWTPVPTGTPPPRCWVKNNSNYRTNLRRDPVIANNIIGAVDRGEVVPLFEATSSNSYVWARTLVDGKIGWFVIWGGNWWVYSLGSETQACVDIPGWPGDELPPEINPPPPPTPTPTPRPPQTRARLYWHDVTGGNVGEMRQAWAILDSKGIGFGVKMVNDPAACNAAVNAGGECIARSVHPADCPPGIPGPGGAWTDPAAAARDWVRQVETYTVAQNIRPQYVELINECYMGNPSTDRRTMQWWDAFMAEAVVYAHSRGWPPLALPSLNPGAGDTEFLRPFQHSLTLLMQYGGLFSTHDYGIYNLHLVQAGSCDVYTSCRHRLIRVALDNLGLQGLQITVTEVARGSGNEPVDEADFIAWYELVSRDEGLHSVALWTAGHTGAWPNANLNGHMVGIAQGVQ